LAVPLVLILSGFITGRARLGLTGWALGQAALLGSLLSSTYKAFTGRVHPEHFIGADLSHEFRFGWLRGGVFWGWPSSHTTIAFAMAVTVCTLFPQRRRWTWPALAYAGYIGLGVSMTIHWFSDFVAGAILGTIIGAQVGKGFRSAQPA
jgi:membrane-associated phospholipid phosphatase